MGRATPEASGTCADFAPPSLYKSYSKNGQAARMRPDCARDARNQPLTSSPLLLRRRRQLRQRPLQRRVIVILVFELAGEIIRVSLHVEMAVAGEVKEDRGRGSFVPRLQR